MVSHGSGCAPSALHVPAITSIGTPRPGGPIGVDISSPSTAGGLTLVTYGFSSTFDPIFNLPLPIDLGSFGFPGCSIYASTEFSIGIVLDVNGEGSHSFHVPALVKWCEREVTFQSFHLSSASDLLASNGLTAIIGN